MIDGVYGFNIAVKDLDAATAQYESILGVAGKPLAASDFAFPGLAGTRFDFGGLAIILITSTEPDTSVAKFLDTRGEGLFLVSLTATDMAETVASLKDKGIVALLDPARDTQYGAVTFLHPKSAHGVQLEIIEPA
ncbi:VOC family protein [Mycolicibacterium goodii]|uniref:VOC family protein n=1 Tax=Mycolicibacterium goodii TaxID=134601 RepID=UPI000673958E